MVILSPQDLGLILTTETSPGMILQHVQVPNIFWGWVFPYIRRIHPAYIADPDIFHHHQGYMTDLGGLVVAYALAAGSFATGSISGGPVPTGLGITWVKFPWPYKVGRWAPDAVINGVSHNSHK